MLHQVAATRPVLPGVGLETPHGIPLVEPRKYDFGTRLGTLRRLVDMNEAAQDVQPGVTAPHLLPQVRGAVPVGVRRIALAEFMTLVERQEPSARSVQPRRHRHRERINSKMHHAEPTQGPVPLRTLAVLSDGILDALTRERVLELNRSDQNAVHEQAQVDGLVAARFEGQLPGDRQHVRVVALSQLGRQAMSRPKAGELDRDVAIHHTPAQHVDGAPLVQLGRQPQCESGLRLVTVAAVGSLDQAFPISTLCLSDELE